MALPFYQLKDLVKAYRGHVALDVSELTFTAGRIYAVVGPNGAGKTTLLRILALVERPSSGKLVVAGHDIGQDRDGIYALRKRVTLVFQQPLLFGTTVERNVDYGLRARGFPRSARKERVAECLRLVGLEGFEKRKAATLSGGETQRVALARAAALRPEAILLDEPTSSVDEASVSFIEDLMLQLNRKHGTTVIFSTHDLSQAYCVADEVVGLAGGRLTDLAAGNFFAGRLAWGEGRCFFDTGKIKVEVIPPLGGAARYISVPAEDIIISLDPIVSSARNSFAGRVRGLREEGHTVVATVDAGEVFRVRITRLSCQEMRLGIGREIYLSFKSSSVKLF